MEEGLGGQLMVVTRLALVHLVKVMQEELESQLALMEQVLAEVEQELLV